MNISVMAEFILRARAEEREMRGEVRGAYYLINLGSPFDGHLGRLMFDDLIVEIVD